VLAPGGPIGLFRLERLLGGLELVERLAFDLRVVELERVAKTSQIAAQTTIRATCL